VSEQDVMPGGDPPDPMERPEGRSGDNRHSATLTPSRAGGEPVR
jgi:hypothetical protein